MEQINLRMYLFYIRIKAFMILLSFSISTHSAKKIGQFSVHSLLSLIGPNGIHTVQAQNGCPDRSRDLGLDIIMFDL